MRKPLLPTILSIAPLFLACAGTDTAPPEQPDSMALTPAAVAEIVAQLAERAELDQAVRANPAELGKGGEADAEMHRVDLENTTWLQDVVTRHGWIDVERFGAEAADDAFLLVQHSGDLPLMRVALPQIEKDVRAGVLDPQNFALLWDRTQLQLGEKQRYGTQIVPDELGELVLAPLEDPEGVEARRTELGLIPLSTYLELVEKAYGGRVKR